MKRLVLLLLAGLFAATQASAQNTGQITGTVSDGTGAPLVGVAVTVVGGSLGTLSGQNGRFTVQNVPAGTHQVRAARLGYGESTQTVTVTAGQPATANFTLTATAVELEGVVAIGYGTVQRRDVTGSIASVSAEAIKEIPTPSVGEALKGRVAGMQISTNNYRPGDNPNIRIRGARSLEASNDPLIVVDGVAVAGGLGDINPQTVESIDVLKDASATAVYGSRGANGVILITTNRGVAGSTRLTYDTRYGVQQIHNKLKPFSGPQYAQFKREAARTANKYGCPAGVNQCEEGDRELFSPLEYENIQAGNFTDYVDLIARDGSIMDHQLGVTGGSEDTRFSMGVNYLQEDGVTIAQDFRRRGANVSLDHESGRLHAGISANVINQLRNLGRGDALWGGAFNINPLANYRDAEGNILGTPIPDGQSWNPLLDAANWDRETLRTRTFGNAFLGYELLDGLELQTTFGADMIFRREGEFRGAMTQPNRGSSNNAWIERWQTFNYVSTSQATLERQLADAHRINATVVYEIQKETEDRSRTDVQNLPYEYQTWYNLATAASLTGASANFEEWLLQSVMGRVHYTLLDRYNFTMTGRQDCSSRLAPGNKCTFFPSAAVRWRLSDEAFLQNQGLFSDLSLRLSYGRTGNTSIDPYETQGRLTRTEYSFGNVGAGGFRPDEEGLANDKLEWEKTETYDLGLDFGILNNRITGTVDGYVANTFDLLMERQLPTTSGFTNVLENVGETKNRGLEVAVSTVNLDGWKGLTWTTDVNFSVNRNEIVSLYGGNEDDVGNNWFIGEPIEVFYQLEFDGIWQADEAAAAESYSRKVGDIKVVDQNADGVINSDDRVLIGNHEDFPSWTGGLSNRLQYGAFDLSSLIVARRGYMVNADLWPGAMAGRYNQIALDYWTPENPSNRFPRPNSDQESAIDNAALRLMDASHWRVRNITLGYNVPTALTSRIGNGTSLRLYAQAQDPFVFTDFPGFDPEGAAGTQVPSFRTLLFGASVGF